MIAASGERVVYQKCAAAGGRKALKRNPYASAQAVRDEAGQIHLYLNCAKPERHAHPEHASVCPRCGYGYTAMLLNPEGVCPECRLERAASRGRALERALNINLGWGHSDYEDVDRAYTYEVAHQRSRFRGSTHPQHAH